MQPHESTNLLEIAVNFEKYFINFQVNENNSK